MVLGHTINFLVESEDRKNMGLKLFLIYYILAPKIGSLVPEIIKSSKQ